ncbi:uncharacterized protein LOC115483756, partial [Drosophila hydei]|uniref:Uncharacterized protein LOC115483756 n=1 Tax=Drosophila hydei TaxID=7224 RepID=A0A6J2SVL1_DROHY
SNAVRRPAAAAAEEQLAKERAQEESIAVQREEQLRQKQRIEKAQQLLEQLRPGPRELHCAKLQSEVLRGIIAQRQLQTQFAAANEQQSKRWTDASTANRCSTGWRRRSCANNSEASSWASTSASCSNPSSSVSWNATPRKLSSRELERLERQRNQLQVKQQLDKERTEQAAKVQPETPYALASLESAETPTEAAAAAGQGGLALCEVHNEAKARLTT